MLWPFDINWGDRPVERLEWLTNVIMAEDDTEQCIKLRNGARRTLRFKTLVGSDRERVLYENTVIAGQPQNYQLPLFIDAAIITSPVGELDTAISVDSTENKAFSAGGEVALISGLTAILAVCESVASNTITLADPVGEFPSHGKIIPVVSARLQAAQQLTYLTDQIMTAEVEFLLEDEWTGTPADEQDDYRGYPVYLTRTDWGEDVAASISRAISEFDSRSGKRAYFDKSGSHRTTLQHRWVLHGRQEISNYKAWLAAREGRYNPFWKPSNFNDFRVLNDVADTATQIDVENAGHRSVNVTGRQDIMIELHNGQRYYRRITDVQYVDDDIEQVTIDAALGDDVAVADIARISYMRLMRLASDAAEIAYDTDGIATASLNFMSKRDMDSE